MKVKKRYYLIVFIVMIAIVALVFIDNKLWFFKYDTNIEDVKFLVTKNSKSETNNELMWFAYADGDIILNVNMLLDTENINVCSLTDEGVEDVSLNNIETKENHKGSYIAYAKDIIKTDFDGDKNEENVHIFAKTDTIATQGFEALNPCFSNEKIPFEVVLKDKNKIYLYYKQQVLSNSEVRVDTKDSVSSKKMRTSVDGELKGLSLSEIRKGLNISYKDGTNCYVMSYQVEDNTLFTNRHYQAMKPLFIIFAVSIVGIILITILRDKKRIKRNWERFEARDILEFIKDKFGIIKKFFKNRPIDFMTFRWIVMMASFIFIVYGVKIFGKWIHGIEIPTFACPQNQDQIVESACYKLSHLKEFISTSTVKELGMFFGGLLLSIILFGRMLCGFVCPFGLYQDIINEIRQIFKIKGISFNEKIWSAIKLIKWQLIIIFIGACFAGLNFCNFCPAIITSPAFAGFKVSLYMSGFVIIVVTITSFFKRRFWCNICPLGYLIGIFHKISIFKLKKNCQACTGCGACYEACPMGIKSIYTERNKTDITTSNCIMCGECVKKCPENDAIAMAVVKKKFYVSSRFNFFNKKKKNRK